MTTVSETVAELAEECAAHIELHQRFARRLATLNGLAASHISPHDVGETLLVNLGDEAKVKAFLRQMSIDLDATFKNWYSAARLAAHERKTLK